MQVFNHIKSLGNKILMDRKNIAVAKVPWISQFSVGEPKLVGNKFRVVGQPDGFAVTLAALYRII